MTREEDANGRDDMQIDEIESERKPDTAFPDEFNSNYLRLYYGSRFIKFKIVAVYHRFSVC